VLHTWDGLVSCLRTRTFREMAVLFEEVVQERREMVRKEATADGYDEAVGGYDTLEEDDEWTISCVRQRHTWPFGYMNAFVGIRKEIRRES